MVPPTGGLSRVECYSLEKANDMELPFEPGVPLTTVEHDVVRISNSRVTLDTVVFALNGGANAEEIAHRYPSLQLADISAVIDYYLRHRAEVDAYLKNRENSRAAVRQENEAKFPSVGLRERLLARRRE